MKELKDKVKDLIEEYFDKKLEYVDWHYDVSAENRVNSLINECVDDVLNELEGYDDSVDRQLEELEKSYSKTPSLYWEDYREDCIQRTMDLISERR